MKTTIVRWLMPMAGAVLALALISWLYGGVDVAKFLRGLSNANLVWIVVLSATILLEQLLSGWKWRQILHDVKPVPTLRLTGALLAGYGANTLVPLGISPLVRAWIVARHDGLSMATVLTTTIIARFVDGVVFALFAGFVVLAGRVPQIDGNLETGLSVAGMLNIAIFGGALWVMYRFRTLFAQDGPPISRLFDRVTTRVRVNGPELRAALCDGVVWPKARSRRLAVFVAAVSGKLVAATHFFWAGLALGVWLTPWDYLFLMVFAGFAMVLGRFVRIPGSFVIGAGFALKMLGVPDETALLMVLFVNVTSIILVVGIGLMVLWRNGIDSRHMRRLSRTTNAET
tara:strand:- start:33478 stop:34506 length:1029 start_codon:yes stop_codon:yes gene_type:complete